MSVFGNGIGQLPRIPVRLGSVTGIDTESVTGIDTESGSGFTTESNSVIDRRDRLESIGWSDATVETGPRPFRRSACDDEMVDDFGVDSDLIARKNFVTGEEILNGVTPSRRTRPSIDIYLPIVRGDTRGAVVAVRPPVVGRSYARVICE